MCRAPVRPTRPPAAVAVQHHNNTQQQQQQQTATTRTETQPVHQHTSPGLPQPEQRSLTLAALPACAPHSAAQPEEPRVDAQRGLGGGEGDPCRAGGAADSRMHYCQGEQQQQQQREEQEQQHEAVEQQEQEDAQVGQQVVGDDARAADGPAGLPHTQQQQSQQGGHATVDANAVGGDEGLRQDVALPPAGCEAAGKVGSRLASAGLGQREQEVERTGGHGSCGGVGYGEEPGVRLRDKREAGSDGEGEGEGEEGEGSDVGSEAQAAGGASNEEQRDQSPAVVPNPAGPAGAAALAAGGGDRGGGGEGGGRPPPCPSRYDYRAPLPVPRVITEEDEEGCWELPPSAHVAAVPYM